MTTFRAVNPATGEPLEPEFTSATPQDVDRACTRAAEAFATFKKTSGAERGRMLRAIASNLEASGAAIVERAHVETALPAARLQGELARTTGQLRLFASVVEEGSWVDARIDHRRPDIRSMLRPLGPVAVFGASNFPLAFSVAGGDTASALAAGCPVVVKAHPAHPGTSELAARAIAKAVPDGVFAILFDSGYDIGIRLVQHPAIRAVGFTGSRRGGQALMDAAAKRAEPIPVYAEMGSINPVFILPGAMRERASAIAAGLQASVTLGSGQFCTNPGLVIAHGDDVPAFLKELEAKMSACAPMTMLTAGIADAYRSGVQRIAAILDTPRNDEPRSTVDANMFVATPEAFLRNPQLADEVFGPSTLVIACDRHADLVDVARSLEGQLTVTMHATDRDLELHRELLDLVEEKAGRIVVNGFPTGVEVAPAMVHGGPWPATSDSRSTSVGTRAIVRFARPVCYQDFADAMLPDELKEENPLRIARLVDGRLSLP